MNNRSIRPQEYLTVPHVDESTSLRVRRKVAPNVVVAEGGDGVIWTVGDQGQAVFVVVAELVFQRTIKVPI